jgi:hypothetical protein
MENDIMVNVIMLNVIMVKVVVPMEHGILDTNAGKQLS